MRVKRRYTAAIPSATLTGHEAANDKQERLRVDISGGLLCKSAILRIFSRIAAGFAPNRIGMKTPLVVLHLTDTHNSIKIFHANRYRSVIKQ
jgi:hypothetical protein